MKRRFEETKPGLGKPLYDNGTWILVKVFIDGSSKNLGFTYDKLKTIC